MTRFNDWPTSAYRVIGKEDEEPIDRWENEGGLIVPADVEGSST